ncbi:acetoacetate decarboxylase [Tersicoccus sp. Bi-70]|uniref:acetoacetate decarboxylase n=1 Tax=Tersicoccus sp. Bi-70 TaxID=1897634 RepID=UPI0009783CFC|nr:acetoacetate decarboxylase [Tersicoccus sp. Bi-70]OMH34207.1 acetoacetate decarboxylase [Tersicoccus sp. Bi-70]
MTLDDVIAAGSTPLTAPAYSRRPHRFTNREYLTITYRTDPEALRAAVPEPLTPHPDALVRFEVMRMNQVTGFGPYTESGQAILVTFDGEEGEYLHAMYLDHFGATTSGRELSAYPKAPGSPRLRIEAEALVGTLDIGSERVATATMRYQDRPLDPAEAAAQIGVPTFMVKMIPGYTGPTAVDLVRTRITDLTVTEAWTGDARLALHPHVLAPLADLPVRDIVATSHILADLTLAPVQPVFSYLEATR